MNRKLQNIFMTGTDTGVGKTFSTILIGKYLQKKGIDVGYFKPIETGCDEDLVPEDANLVKNELSLSDDIELICPVRFKFPLAPYAASKIENKSVNFDLINKSWQMLNDKHDIVLTEGAGGLLVPISNDLFMIDLINYFDIPALLISKNILGTINHTLLSLNYLKYKKIDVKAVILNKIDKQNSDMSSFSNYEVIKDFTKPLSIMCLDYKQDETETSSNISNDFDDIFFHNK